MTWVLLFLLAFLPLPGSTCAALTCAGFDAPLGQRFPGSPVPCDEHDAVLASLAVSTGPVQRAPRSKRLGLVRGHMDNMSNGLVLASTVTPVDAGGVPPEWVIAQVQTLRAVCCIYGGAFDGQSPQPPEHHQSLFRDQPRGGAGYRLSPDAGAQAHGEDRGLSYGV